MIAFGFSCALKPQAIFWCPLLAGLLATGRLPWKTLCVPVAVYGFCGVPQMLAGRPIIEVLLHWGGVKNQPGLTLGAPNWYQWVRESQTEILWCAGVLIACLATIIFLFLMVKGPGQGLDEKRWLVAMALLSVLFPPFFLPGMHERYFFPADVLSVLYAFSFQRGWIAASLIQFASAFAYVPYLFHITPVPLSWLAAMMAIAIVLVVIQCIQLVQLPVKPKNDDSNHETNPMRSAECGVRIRNSCQRTQNAHRLSFNRQSAI
jgi:Gpi18-like mannosyltransferase